eukprot:11163376-Lingulodinium_polyedra.AAC.1
MCRATSRRSCRTWASGQSGSSRATTTPPTASSAAWPRTWSSGPKLRRPLASTLRGSSRLGTPRSSAS